MEIKLVSFIKVKTGTSQLFLDSLKNLLEIVRIQSITGYFDILIEINVNKSEELIETIEKIEKIPGLIEIHSHFILEEWEK